MSDFTFPEGGITPENFDATFDRFKEYEAARHAFDAQARFLRGLWPIIREFTEDRVKRPSRYDSPSIQRLLDAGADPSDVSKVMCYAAYSAVHSTLVRLDEVHDYDMPFPEDATGWKVMEVRISDGPSTDGGLTGRDLAGLHESIRAEDPSGTDAVDLWE